MLTIPTIEDCARYAGLDTTGLKRREHTPTLREIRIAAQFLRTPAGVWLPRAWVEEFIKQNAIREEGGTGWQDFGEMATDYNRLMYGASVGTGWWKSGWAAWDADENPGLPPEPQPGEVFFSIPTQYVENPPLPPAVNIEKLQAQIDAQYIRAVENMAKAIAVDLSTIFSSNPIFKRLSGDGLKAEDFNMPPFQFGWSGFKAASAGIGAAGTFLIKPLGATAEEFQMNRLREQGFDIEVIKEEKTGE